jgi:hypothetical protein
MTISPSRLPQYQNPDLAAAETKDFNAYHKSEGTLLRDTASRKSTKEALEYLNRNLHGLRRGTPMHEHLIGRVKSSRRPLATAKSICRDFASSTAVPFRAA